MNRLAIPIVAFALLTAACGGATTLTNSKAQPATIASATQVNGGANAGSDISDVNRTNPPVHRPGTIQPSPAAAAQSAAPAAGQPRFGTALDRCGSGSGVGAAGNRGGSTGFGRRLPGIMCEMQ